MAIDFKKIDKKKAGIIILAIVAGLVAVALTNNYINTSVSKGSSSEEVKYLLGKVKQLSQDNKALYEKQEVTARQLRQQIQALSEKQPRKRTSNLEEKGPRRQSLAIKTPSGKRAITVKIKTLNAVGGLLNPGDFVDVLSILNIVMDPEDPKSKRKVTVTLFQNIQILAIGPNVDSHSNFAAQQKSSVLTITLAVDPEQTEMLTFAQKNGELRLVLRGPMEKSSYQLPQANWDTFKKYLSEIQGVDIVVPRMKTKKEIKKEKKEEEEKSSVQIFRGGGK